MIRYLLLKKRTIDQWCNVEGISLRCGKSLEKTYWSKKGDRLIDSLLTTGPSGQHVELGIAENNLFLLLASAGLAGTHFKQRLFPIGTLYVNVHETIFFFGA